MNKIGNKLEKAVEILNKGGLVAIPTETVYGLAANALESKSVAKIFAAKKRPSFDPLIVHCKDFASLKSFTTELPALAERFSKAFHPGPLTLILPKTDVIPDIVTSGHNTVGLRIPGHPLTLELLERLSFPLAAPSANPFGYVSPTTAQHVANQLNDEVDYILDGGPCNIGIESTIIKIEGEDYEILRLGGIALEVIEKVAEKPPKSIKLGSSNPAAPGMLSVHYSPNKRVILFSGEPILGQYQPSDVGAITFKNYLNEIPKQNQFLLSSNGNLNEAAAQIFNALRSFENLPVKAIFAEILPEEGLGRAINDRLKRAASKS
jgi:L-threonylcarbamoyladenylate synthase